MLISSSSGITQSCALHINVKVYLRLIKISCLWTIQSDRLCYEITSVKRVFCQILITSELHLLGVDIFGVDILGVNILGVNILGVNILGVDICELTFWELTFWELGDILGVDILGAR